MVMKSPSHTCTPQSDSGKNVDWLPFVPPYSGHKIWATSLELKGSKNVGKRVGYIDGEGVGSIVRVGASKIFTFPSLLLVFPIPNRSDIVRMTMAGKREVFIGSSA